MKRFKTKSKRLNHDFIIILIIFITFLLINYYDYRINNKLINIASAKMKEISTMYIKKDIIPKNKDLSKLIIINKNKNDEILYVDVNYDYANIILNEIVTNIQNNINNLSQVNSNEIKNYKDNLYIELPLYLFRNGSLISNLGPKIPIKLSFYEYVLGTIDSEIEEYGINNVLLKVYLDIELRQKLIMPYQEKELKDNLRLILGTKIINGTVPDFYGGFLHSNSSIISTQ